MIFKHKIHTGLLSDPRSQELKDKDWHIEELIPLKAPNWIDYEVWRQQPENIQMLKDIQVSNQHQTSACVSYSLGLISAINNYLEEKKFKQFSGSCIVTGKQIGRAHV